MEQHLFITKRWVSGHLKGLCYYSEKIYFNSMEKAVEFISKYNRKGKVFKMGTGDLYQEFTVEDCSFQNYSRR